MALEQPEVVTSRQPGLLSDPICLSRYGLIHSPIQAGTRTTYHDKYTSFLGSPEGLPVGFSKLPTAPDPVTGEMQPDQLGFTSAACHTGQIDYQGTSLRSDGAPQ